MILRMYFAILKIAARYGAASRRFSAVYSEDSRYEVYKMAYGFHKKGDNTYEINKELFEKLKTDGLIVDASDGGLVLGHSHEDGGIYLVRQYPDKILLVGEVEGWEYIFCKKVSENEHEKIQAINAKGRDVFPWRRFSEYTIPQGITIIDGRKKLVKGCLERPLLLLTGDRHWIVNKWSTQEHLRTLEKMNVEKD